MEKLDEYKDLLITGAEMEHCGEKENAERIYKSYIKEAATTADGQDCLVTLYGPYIYQARVTTYSDAVSWATIALCAKKLVELMRSQFPESNCWRADPSQSPPKDLIKFFEWLSQARRGVDFSKDYSIIKNAYSSLKVSNVINIEFANRTAVRPLMYVVNDLVNNQLWITGGKLQS